MSKDHTKESSGWNLAVNLLKKYLLKPSKIDELLHGLPEALSSMDRKICQMLFFGVVRHKSLIDYVIGKLVVKKPRIGLRVILMIGIYEMIDGDTEKYPKVVE